MIITIPLSNYPDAVIKLPNPMTEKQWEQLMAYLSLIKEAIVSKEVPDAK